MGTHDAAMVEVTSSDAIFAGNRKEVPKSRSIAFTLGRNRHRIWTSHINNSGLRSYNVNTRVLE